MFGSSVWKSIVQTERGPTLEEDKVQARGTGGKTAVHVARQGAARQVRLDIRERQSS